MNITSGPPRLETKPQREQVAALAYNLWEKGGRQPGHDQEYWFEAEKQLNASSPAAPPETAAKSSGQTRSTASNHVHRASNGRSRSEVGHR